MTKRPTRRAIPTFRSEAEERHFWETHDTSPFVDWSKPGVAGKRDVPYQSLLKVFLAERVEREANGVNGPSAALQHPRKRRRQSRTKRSRLRE
jgi:hypothetical protein